MTKASLYYCESAQNLNIKSSIASIIQEHIFIFFLEHKHGNVGNLSMIYASSIFLEEFGNMDPLM